MTEARTAEGQCETCGHDADSLTEMLPGIEGSPFHCIECCVEGLDDLPEGWQEKPDCQHPFAPKTSIKGHVNP